MFGEISHSDAVVIIPTASVTEDKIRGKRDFCLFFPSTTSRLTVLLITKLMRERNL